MTENERVKELRKARGLTLEQFGARLGVGRSTVSAIETGQRSLTRQNLLSICREFGVREEWMRDGTEPMEVSQDSVSLDDLIKDAGLEGREADIIKQLVQIFCSLKPGTRRDILAHFDEYFGNPEDEVVETFRVEGDEIAAQLNDEKEPAAKLSAFRAASSGAKEA